ncbi:MAG: hypothetical protein KatS3mg108_2315 [Isosphaeraceae bacterium]|jgi:thioredoxin-like negative regulator of GroEL|nr:MAG: hypothetical protein KatS3mg108_2315 [Isosphaeraceae bacterium]
MAEKSPRRRALEASLAADPTDAFLRYGLALQCLREGDRQEGQQRLRELIADDPAGQVAAYQQLGQSYLEDGQFGEARRWLSEGVRRARDRGDDHAASEMEALLEQVDALG